MFGLRDTAAGDIHAALTLPMNDFEDAVIAAAAKGERADYLIIRNEAGFTGSPVPALNPAKFLERYWKHDEGKG